MVVKLNLCGDWHPNRNSLNITTMDATIRSLRKLGKAFEKFYFLLIMIYTTKIKEILIPDFARHIEGITMVNEMMTEGDVTLILVGWR